MTLEDKDTITIIVNMEKKMISVRDLSPNGEISFEQVVKIAEEGGKLPSGPYIEYEVSYDNAIRPKSGKLEPGQRLKIQDETTFNVTATDVS